MTSLRLPLSPLGATARPFRKLRGHYRVRRGWAGAVTPPAREALPEPFLWGDAEVGRRLVAGEWRAFGHSVLLGAGFWGTTLPDPRLEAERDTFRWLDDLAALGTRKARQLAQRWTFEWIDRFGRGRGPGWQPERAGARIFHWTAHAGFLTEGLGETDTARFWQAVAAHGRALSKGWRDAGDLAARVEALAGAVHALALVADPSCDEAADELARLAARAVDPAGGTPSRAPEDLARIVIALVWSARILETFGRHARPPHLHAIARAVPVLRALRLGDGSTARFQGGGPGDPVRLDQALAELRLAARAKPRLPMGYARLAGGRVVAVMDGGLPPTGPDASGGAAGTLAFEMSAGTVPIIVNAGPGAAFGPAADLASRGTAAHSTVEIAGMPSARLRRPRTAGRAAGSWIAQGPSLVSVRQAQDATGQWLLATHDGYVETLGLLHERRLFVDAKGTELRGEEIVHVPDARARRRFDAASRRRRDPMVLVAHFHLHPDVAAAVDPVRQVVEIRPPGIDTWIFRTGGGRVELRESRHFDPTAAAPLPSLQIMVIVEVIEYLGQVNWSFTRVPTTQGHGRRSLAGGSP